MDLSKVKLAKILHTMKIVLENFDLKPTLKPFVSNRFFSDTESDLSFKCSAYHPNGSCRLHSVVWS